MICKAEEEEEVDAVLSLFVISRHTHGERDADNRVANASTQLRVAHADVQVTQQWKTWIAPALE